MHSSELLPPLPDGVRELELTPEKVDTLWTKMNEIPGLFDDGSKGDFHLFMSRLLDRESVWYEMLDGEGIFYASSMMPGLSATGHIVFFDKTLSDKKELTTAVMRHVMVKYNLKKINVYIPDFAMSARRFALKLGFSKEGILRRWAYNSGRLYDMWLYGMTFEEAFDGSAEL